MAKAKKKLVAKAKAPRVKKAAKPRRKAAASAAPEPEPQGQTVGDAFNALIGVGERIAASLENAVDVLIEIRDALEACNSGIVVTEVVEPTTEVPTVDPPHEIDDEGPTDDGDHGQDD